MTVISLDKDLESLTVTLVARFDAPVERVWQLWADPRQLERWWGPPDYPATFVSHSLTVGGEAAYYMTGPDGAKSHGWWRVTAVDPPASLAFTDGFANEDGTPNAETPTTSTSMQLTEHDGSTLMELRFTFDSRDAMREWESWGTVEGLTAAVGQIDALLAAGPNR